MTKSFDRWQKNANKALSFNFQLNGLTPGWLKQIATLRGWANLANGESCSSPDEIFIHMIASKAENQLAYESRLI